VVSFSVDSDGDARCAGPPEFSWIHQDYFLDWKIRTMSRPLSLLSASIANIPAPKIGDRAPILTRWSQL
jgi:hypothetical protein